MHFLRNAIRLIFYAHFFYGICAVALAVEATHQHQLPTNQLAFLLLLLLGVAAYYNSIYLKAIPKKAVDERSAFYQQHHSWLRILNYTIVATCFLLATYLAIAFHRPLAELSFTKWLLLVLFPLAAFAYTYKKLRRVGWLKAFLLGFIWSGIVTVYPVIFSGLETGTATNISAWLWLKNFMFISVLSIMFDIKDLETDKKYRLHTYPVMFGVQRTIELIIIPMVIVGIFSFLAFTVINGFPMVRIIFNIIPYLLLLVSAYSLQISRPVIYYLVVIDGLMIVKAICGILAAELIKS